MKKALITGITGQDGAYLSRFLLEKGYQVHGIVRDSSLPAMTGLTYLGIKEKVLLHVANMLDLSNVIRLLDMIAPDEIYHLAAQSSVAISFEQPIWTIDFNVMSTLHILEAMRLLHLQARFYQASSSEMYGSVKELPVTERSVFNPVSPYAISKGASHWIARNYREAYGLFCCCGILFNHESVLRPPQFVTKKVIASAVRIRMGLEQGISLGDVNIRRDWGYAPEYVKAMWLMLQQEEPDDFVIASGESHTLQEFVQLAFAHAGLDYADHLVTDKALYRPSDIHDIYGDSAKARRVLGWTYTLPFGELIRLLVEEEMRYQGGGLAGREEAEERDLAYVNVGE